jgi:hypothetical protein
MKAKIRDVRVLSCSASWRNYFFLKITTEDGVVGWSEFDEGFGSPGVSAVIEQLSHRLIGQSAMHHEHIREDLRSITRPGSGRRRRPGARRDRERAARRQGQDARRAMLRTARRQGPRPLRVYWSHCVDLAHAPPALSAGDRRHADGVRADRARSRRERASPRSRPTSSTMTPTERSKAGRRASARPSSRKSMSSARSCAACASTSPSCARRRGPTSTSCST